MSDDPTIMNPKFDASTQVDPIEAGSIEVGSIGHNATVDPVHPNLADARQAARASIDVPVPQPNVPPPNVPAPIIPLPDIARIDDDPTPPAPENLAKPMM